MRFLVLIAALFLTGCWAGEALYSDSDAKQPIPAGSYRAINEDGKDGVENVVLLPNGMTQIGDPDGKALYGFAPLDDQNRRFIVWYRENNDNAADARGQVYLLLERRSNDEFVMYMPKCDDLDSEIAAKAGAIVEKGAIPTCHFKSRASLETAMRQLRPTKDLIRIVRVRGE